MKKVEIMGVEEATPRIPIKEQSFVDLGELEGGIEIESYDGSAGNSYLYRFGTKDFGECYGHSNPLCAVADGYFRVEVPQGEGRKPFQGFCTNERIIATLKSVIVHGKETGKMLGEFGILGEEEARKVYEEYGIPRFTLI